MKTTLICSCGRCRGSEGIFTYKVLSPMALRPWLFSYGEWWPTPVHYFCDCDTTALPASAFALLAVHYDATTWAFGISHFVCSAVVLRFFQHQTRSGYNTLSVLGNGGVSGRRRPAFGQYYCSSSIGTCLVGSALGCYNMCSRYLTPSAFAVSANSGHRQVRSAGKCKAAKDDEFALSIHQWRPCGIGWF